MSEMSILVSVNRDFVPPLKAMLHSLYMNNPHHKINIHLLHTELIEEDIGAVNVVVKKYGGELFAYVVDDYHKNKAGITSKIPVESFYRLLATEYLPENVKKLLYLDSDIIINGSLESLYETDLTAGNEKQSGYLFAAAADPIEDPRSLYSAKVLKRDIGLDDNLTYVNAGVLLINLELMRAANAVQRILSSLPSLLPRLLYYDQDVLNLLFNEQILCLDPLRYNLCVNFPQYNSFNIEPGKPAIIHFASVQKPWSPGFVRSRLHDQAKQLYDKYASM